MLEELFELAGRPLLVGGWGGCGGGWGRGGL